eukprot:gene9125-12309_t
MHSSTGSDNMEREYSTSLSKKKYSKRRIQYRLWNVVILKLLVIILWILPIESLSNCLQTGQSLYVGDYLLSSNGLVTLLFQSDGNICIYYASSGAPSGTSTWCTDLLSASPHTLTMESDGSLNAYDTSGNTYFSTSLTGYSYGGSFFAIMQCDQNFVVYGLGNNPEYACNTENPP